MRYEKRQVVSFTVVFILSANYIQNKSFTELYEVKGFLIPYSSRLSFRPSSGVPLNLIFPESQIINESASPKIFSKS